jgi:hypothetical protein
MKRMAGGLPEPSSSHPGPRACMALWTWLAQGAHCCLFARAVVSPARCAVWWTHAVLHGLGSGTEQDIQRRRKTKRQGSPETRLETRGTGLAMVRCRFNHDLSSFGFRGATAAAAWRRAQCESPPRQITHVTCALSAAGSTAGIRDQTRQAFASRGGAADGKQGVSFGEQTGESNSRLQGRRPFWNRLTECIQLM